MVISKLAPNCFFSERRISTLKPDYQHGRTIHFWLDLFSMWSNLDVTARPWPLIHGSLQGKWLPTPRSDLLVVLILCPFISASFCFS